MIRPARRSAERGRGRRRPRFSLITAVYRSAPYLPDYLDSLAALEGGLSDTEIIFVDDGSPDESVDIISDWTSRVGIRARLLATPHGGSVAARNTGLDAARGDWISFPDPDDALDPAYLAAIRSFLDECIGAGDEPSVLAPKVIQFRGDPADAVDDHPLGYRYRSGRRLVRLTDEPRWFHTHAPSGFYRRDLVERTGLRLDPRLGAAFEDAAFAAHYLLDRDDPTIGVVPDAVYRYRRRADSVTGTMWSKGERYTAVPEHGYLPLIARADPPPVWLQLLVLYDLVWYFVEYENPTSPNRSIAPETKIRFLDLLDRTLAGIREDLILAYPLHPLARHLRVALAARKTGRITLHDAAVGDDGDTRTITYFTEPGNESNATVLLDGSPVHPVQSSQRECEYYGEVFVVEHTLRVPASGALMMLLDGVPVPLAGRDGGAARFAW
jgi:glycosyltransferase involved in cell wall biosynthesis